MIRLLPTQKKDRPTMKEKPTKIQNNDLIENQPQEDEPQEAREERKPLGLRFRFGPGHLLPAGLLLLATGLLFFLCPSLFQDAETGGFLPDGFFIAFCCLSLLGTVLFLTELRLPLMIRRIAGGSLLFLAPLGAFIAVDTINGTRLPSFPVLRSLGNYLCYLMVFALLYAIFRRSWVTILCGGSAFLLFGVANYFVVQFRGEPILPWDVSAITTAAAVSQGYRYTLTRPMVLSLLGLVCVSVLAAKLSPETVNARGEAFGRARRVKERLCALGLALALVVLIFPANILSSMNISVWAWNQKTSSEITGVLAGFVANIQFLMVEKPADYSHDTVEGLENRLEALEEPEPLGDPEGLPTIIAVMNESFTDMGAVGNLELTRDAAPFLHQLQRSGEVLWGTAYSSVYGGNTCNSEYEFLTGNTTAFLPAGSKPYQQYVLRDQTALPDILKSYGYFCTAIHPGNRNAWHRDTAYPYLGFDRFIAARDFEVQRKLKRGLTTDDSGYDQVIHTYQKGINSGEPQFLFHVTIQNHGGFEDEKYPTTVQVQGREGKWPQAEQYLSLIRESDSAFRRLVTYFSRRSDPVLILFFGDHWPNLETGFQQALLNTDPKDPAFSDLMRQYQVPFLLWANYPLQGQNLGEISMNYLSGLLLRAAGLEGTDYTKYLEELRQEVPVITAVGIKGADGRLYKNGEETPWDALLKDYAILQYNNAFDQDGKAEGIFTR